MRFAAFPRGRGGRLALASLAVALVAGGALGLAQCQTPVARERIPQRLAELERPNLVMIVCDTLRADWTTPYGDPRGTTPELARWAERGVVFERSLAQSTWTKVSMASMLTSLWPRSHGVEKSRDGLGENARTLAEVLKAEGYRTYGVQTNGWLEQSFGFQQGFDRYLFPFPRGQAGRDPSMWAHSERVLEEARRVLEHQDGEEDAPFFLYLHLMDVHEYAAPPDYRKFGTDTEGHYVAAIRWIDDFVRRVREELDDRGLLENTVMVFGSDHGESFGENGLHGHAKNVRTKPLHVPLLIRFPFPVEPPVRVPTQVRNLDIAPTALDLVGVEPPDSFEGRSLLPLITSPGSGEDLPSHAALRETLFRDGVQQQSVNDGRWFYARNLEEDDEREFLFDHAVDPEENVNLIERESEEAERMRALMDEHLAADGQKATVEKKVRINPDISRRLKALGYLESDEES